MVEAADLGSEGWEFESLQGHQFEVKMIDCIVIGDSIAVGVGSVSPNCSTIAKVGINSKNYNIHYNHIPTANTTVISLGSNDGNMDFSKYLESLRKKIKGNVIWILPANNAKARNIVIKIASKYNDRTVRITNTIDNVHPKSYSQLRKKIFGE